VKRLAIVAALIALTLTSCGDPAISRATSRELRADVAAIRDAIETGQVPAARALLRSLQVRVDRLLDRGSLSDDAAIEILGSFDGVLGALDLAPDPSPTVVESATPTPEEEDGGDGGNAYGHDKDKGGGGEGHGKDD
jgi:hypothetical protein